MILRIGGMPFYPIFLCDNDRALGLKTMAGLFEIKLTEDTDGNLTISDEGAHNSEDISEFVELLKNSNCWNVETFKIKDRDIPTIAFVHKEYRNAQRN